MNLGRTRFYEKRYKELPKHLKAAADEALGRFQENAAHPSLRIEKLSGSESLWSLRVTHKVRITFRYGEDEAVVLEDIGGHEVYQRLRSR
jgi:plasmid maintenance system killer protein